MRDFTLIFGCMFSGKTTRLIEMHGSSNAQSHEKMSFKPLLDNRYSKTHLQTHSGLQLPGHRISKPEEIYPLIGSDTLEIYLDEAQFFAANIYEVILDLCLQGKRVIAAGLDKDYLGNDFGAMPKLMSLSNNKVQLYAKCQVCQAKAGHTFRKTTSDDLLLVGHSDIYEARCKEHWESGMQSRS